MVSFTFKMVGPSCNGTECDSQANPCCCVTYCRMGIHGSRLVIWTESMETKNLQCEDHPSSCLCQWPWHRCHALLARGTKHMHPIMELYHLSFEADCGEQGAVDLGMVSPVWLKLLERSPCEF